MSAGTSLDARTEVQEPQGEPSAKGDWRRFAPYLLAVGLVVLVHSAIVVFERTPALDGQLYGTDGYMRLVQVIQLYESGDFFDHTIARSNAPYGTLMHWTRPMDAVLLAGGWMLSPWLGFQEGLFWWAVFVSPLLHLAMVIALVWAVAPLFDQWRRGLLILALLAQPPLLSLATVGHADHHMLIGLAFVIAVGLHLRVLLTPGNARLAFAAGAALGFALWLTMEGLVLLTASFAALTALWLFQGAGRTAANIWHALGLSAMVALAIVTERPPAEYLADEYDRISVVHLAIALLALGFWGAVSLLERLTAQGPGGRSAAAGLGALVAGCLLYLIYPKFFGGPEVDVDPRMGPVIMDLINELRPLVPVDRKSLGEFLLYLGPALVTVPFLAWLLYRKRGSPAWEGWFYVAVCIAAFLPLAIAMRRFAPFTGVLMTIVLAEMLALILIQSENLKILPLRVMVRSGAMVALLLGSTGLGTLLAEPAEATEWAPSCALSHVVDLLNDPDGLGRRPLILLAHFNHGPELLYRTGHAVVASPYHRNVAGNLDSDAIFAAPDDGLARRLVEQRGIDLILFCSQGPAVLQATLRSGGGSTFADRLVQGRVPPWLRRIDLPTGSNSDFRIFRVVR